MFIQFKKALALVLMLGFFMPALAKADSNTDFSTITATMGNKNTTSGDYTMWITNDGVVHYAKDSGIRYPYLTPASTSQTLTAAQSGTTFVLNNAGGVAPSGATMQLPAANPKMSYTFITDVAVNFRIKPATGEIINFSTAIANSKLKNTSAAIGDSIQVFCSTAGQWSIRTKVGTWAVDNNP